MNFDKIDLEALQRDLEEFAREQRAARLVPTELAVVCPHGVADGDRGRRRSTLLGAVPPSVRPGSVPVGHADHPGR